MRIEKRTALISAISLTTLLCLRVPAQKPVTSTPTSQGLNRIPLTPKDVLSIRDIRELQISPDGKKVVFVVREPGDPKLPRRPRTANMWIMPTDGSEPPHPLIPDLNNATRPRWSPDGRWLAFLSDSGESGNDPSTTIQVYLLRSEGGKAERLT